MSQQNKQTPILNINNQISNEEDEIVNKIIHELNDDGNNNKNGFIFSFFIFNLL